MLPPASHLRNKRHMPRLQSMAMVTAEFITKKSLLLCKERRLSLDSKPFPVEEGAVMGCHRLVTARGITFFLTGSLLLAALPLQADDPEGPLAQRTRFLAAKKALEQDDGLRFTQAASGLQAYPLYPYLVYWHLLNKLDEQSPVTIRAFLSNHADTPLAHQLRTAWLQHLAKAKRWKEYLDFYQGSLHAELRCHFHTAQLNTGNQAAAWEGAGELWLVGHSQHQACDGLFAAWDKAKHLTPERRWQRIELAMARGNTDLAGYLAQGLKEKDRREVDLWRKVHANPHLIADRTLLPSGSQRHRAIALYGLKRLASSQPEEAATVWPELSLRHRFDQQQRHEASHAIALHLALKANVHALEWYAALPQESFTASSRGWAVRTALRHKRWLAAIAWIESMPATERQSEMWSYWRGRAYDALGKQEQAEELYRTVSASRSYYGFLAADRVGADYNLSHETLSVSSKALDQLERHPALVRAYELYHLTLTDDARREWDYAVSQMGREERKVAGKLAARWQWYDRALLTLARANHFDDLAIRFPLAYSETVSRESEKHSLDPAWVYAVARQESAMDPNAQSPVGALGLMQLMPATAQTIAKQLATDLTDQQELLQPETNIRLGSYYLNEVLERFSDNPVLATAAYNAGPHRVQRWFPEHSTIDADIWVDTMPFHETRLYVRRVMAYAVFYDQRLERPIRRLSQRMPPVGDPGTLSHCNDCTPATDEPG